MKIETADCVKAIVEYFEGKGGDLTDAKAWKRLSKTGSGNSIKRTFQNKKTGDVVYVSSTETEILSVSENDSIITKFDNFNKKGNSNKSKYVLEVLDFTKSKEEWQKEMYQDEGVNIGIIVWLADDLECMCDQDIPECLPELEELELGEVMLDDNGFLALESELSVSKIKTILKKEGFNLKSEPVNPPTKKIKTIDKIKSQPEFIELNNGNLNGKWETTILDKDDSDFYANLIDYHNDNDIDSFRNDLEIWGGWMCDDIENYINRKLKIENHYLKGTDIIEIDSISFGDKLLAWGLHED